MKSTKYFWLFSPTQLLTQGQWWSIFRMQRLQTLRERQQVECKRQGNEYCAQRPKQQQQLHKDDINREWKALLWETVSLIRHTNQTQTLWYQLDFFTAPNTASLTVRLVLWMQQSDIHVLFALPAVVCSVRFDAAALGTFVDHLPWFQLKAFYVFLSSIPFWHCPLARNMTTQLIRVACYKAMIQFSHWEDSELNCIF